MFCGHCGKQISGTSRFCAYCGHPAGTAHDPSPGQPNTQNTYQGGYGPQGYPPRQYQPGGHYPPPRTGGILSGAGKSAARTAKNMGSYKMLSIIAVLLCILIALFYSQFIKAKKPEDTVADLEKALNNLDTEAMLDCFDEQTQKLYSGSLGLAGSLFDLDLEAISDLATGLGGIMASAGLTPKFTMHITDIEYSNNNTCMVTVDMTISYEGETESETIQLPMKKVDRKWVISIGTLSDFVYN